MDPKLIENSITKQTKAILPVHLYGHPADMKEITSIARAHSLLLIEDCAQSHGAVIDGKKTGTWGDVASFSFYPTKNLGAIGDGGVIVTNNKEIGEKVRLLREYGWRQRYISEISGLNSRLDELQAAILRVKLPHLDEENVCRRKLAHLYNELLQNSGLITPVEKKGVQHVYHQYVIKTQQRDDLKAHLKKYGIDTLIHYPVPIHLQPAYQKTTDVHNNLVLTEEICKTILSLPIHPQLTEEQIGQISEIIIDFVKKV